LSPALATIAAQLDLSADVSTCYDDPDSTATDLVRELTASP
jgi:hypothetical protein